MDMLLVVALSALLTMSIRRPTIPQRAPLAEAAHCGCCGRSAYPCRAWPEPVPCIILPRLGERYPEPKAYQAGQRPRNAAICPWRIVGALYTWTAPLFPAGPTSTSRIPRFCWHSGDLPSYLPVEATSEVFGTAGKVRAKKELRGSQQARRAADVNRGCRMGVGDSGSSVQHPMVALEARACSDPCLDRPRTGLLDALLDRAVPRPPPACTLYLDLSHWSPLSRGKLPGLERGLD